MYFLPSAPKERRQYIKRSHEVLYTEHHVGSERVSRTHRRWPRNNRQRLALRLRCVGGNEWVVLVLLTHWRERFFLLALSVTAAKQNALHLGHDVPFECRLATHGSLGAGGEQRMVSIADRGQAPDEESTGSQPLILSYCMVPTYSPLERPFP